MSDSLRTNGLWPSRLLCPWDYLRQEYSSRLPCPPPWDLPNPGIKSTSPGLQLDSLPTDPYPLFFEFPSHLILTEHWVGFPELWSWFSLVIYFMHSINGVCMLIPVSQFILSLLSTLVSIHIVLYCRCLYFCLQVKFFSGFVIMTGFFSAGTLLSLGILPGTLQKPSCQWPLTNWWGPTTDEPRLLSWTPHLFCQLHCMYLPCGSMGIAVAAWSEFNCHPPYDTHTCTHFVFYSLLHSVTEHQKPQSCRWPRSFIPC